MSQLSLLTALLVGLSAAPARAEKRSTMVDGAAIDAFVAAQVRRHRIPGLAIAVVEEDRVVLSRGYGRADQSGRPMTAATPHILASVSKPITALAVMQLMEAGKVELDVPVQRYLPGFKVSEPLASKEITVRQLLLHTSGFPVTACDTRADAATLQEFVGELATVELQARPGARHVYCSGNYNVLGRIIEVVSGEGFAEFVRARLFTPLQMHHSFTAEIDARVAGLAQGHQWMFGLAVPRHHPFNPSQLPSGYLISSAEDMAHFLIAQLNGGRYLSASVLSSGGIAQSQAPGVRKGEDGSTYGLGWISGLFGGVPAVYHDGVNFDFHSLVLLQPVRRRGFVLLTNSFGIVPYAGAYKEIEEGVARMLADQRPRPGGMSLGQHYLIIDLALAVVLVVTLWPLARLRRWGRRIRERQLESSWRPWRAGLRAVLELGVPVVLLVVVRAALGANLGAQSWSEIIWVFPDFMTWLLAISLVIMLTGLVRLLLIGCRATARAS